MYLYMYMLEGKGSAVSYCLRFKVNKSRVRGENKLKFENRTGEEYLVNVTKQNQQLIGLVDV